MKTKILLAALFVALFAGTIAFKVYADARYARLKTLLTEIETAEERISYTGTRVLEGPDWSMTQRVTSQEGRRRVESVESPGEKKTSRRGHGGRGSRPDGFPDFLRPGRGHWRRRIKDYDLALQNYRVEVSGHGIVAGRGADFLEIRSRHGGRPSYRVAVDAANRFPLRFEALSEGRRVFLTEFREIQYTVPAAPAAGSPPAPRRPSWSRSNREEVPLHEVPTKVDYGIWIPERLPAGFKLRRSTLMRADEGRHGTERTPPEAPQEGARVAHFDYTDGIAALSIVECSAKTEMWKRMLKVSGTDAGEQPGGKIVAWRSADPAGAAFLLKIEDTAILAAGNVAAGEIEEMLKTLKRR